MVIALLDWKTVAKRRNRIDKATELSWRAEFQMDINNLEYFKAITTRMDWLNDRQKVLAENIANSDTPEYRSRDIVDLDFSRVLNKNDGMAHRFVGHAGMMRLTHAGHLTGTGENMLKSNVKEVFSDTDPSPNGNSVILEEEIIKIGKTAENYGLMANAYKKGVGLMKMAVAKSR